MSTSNSPTPSDGQPHGFQRRQLLTTAASLGIAPWLLSACASPPASTATVAGHPSAR